MILAEARAVCRRLHEAGYEALFAGGCVRDRLLGLEPADYDIATSARPEQVEALFEHTVAVGRRFGVVRVQSGHDEFEVATFRKDGAYLDGRRPQEVTFSDSIEDARRRDFTVNALFEDPEEGDVIDYVDGRGDLQQRILRAVGNAGERFAEDRLRLMRAVRFAARFEMRIEAETWKAMQESAASIATVSAERVGEEVCKMLTDGHARRAFELLDECGLLAHVLPEMTAMKGCLQSADQHPEGDVFVHTLICLEHLPPACSRNLALGVLLHDIAKPVCAEIREGRHTFYGHTSKGTDMAVNICKRLRLPNATADRVGMLVHQHLRHCSAAEMKPSTLKRFLRQNGIDELLELTRIDALSSSGDLGHYQYCMRALAELPREKMRPPALINGRDLIGLGLTPGPGFKDILRTVEDRQLDGQISTASEALAFVRKHYL